jgi:hypothetical protein
MAKDKSDADIRQSIISQETRYVDTFFERATTENVETRYRYTQYFSALTRDPEYKKGWDILLTAVQKERILKQQELANAQADAAKKTGDDLQIAQIQIARIMRELEASTKGPPSFLPTSVNYSDIAAKAPCPPNTEMVVSAVGDYRGGSGEESDASAKEPSPRETAIRRAILSDTDQVRYELSGSEKIIYTLQLRGGYTSYTSPDANRLLIARHCLNKEDKVVASGVFFDSKGRVLARPEVGRSSKPAR